VNDNKWIQNSNEFFFQSDIVTSETYKKLAKWFPFLLNSKNNRLKSAFSCKIPNKLKNSTKKKCSAITATILWLVIDTSYVTIILTVSNATKMYSPIIAMNVEKSSELIPRTCLIKKNTGTRLVSFAPNAELLWWTNNLVPKPTEYIVDLVTTLSLPPDAMDVEMSSEQE